MAFAGGVLLNPDGIFTVRRKGRVGCRVKGARSIMEILPNG